MVRIQKPFTENEEYILIYCVSLCLIWDRIKPGSGGNNGDYLQLVVAVVVVAVVAVVVVVVVPAAAAFIDY
jgi:hypothetical protein